MHRKYKRYQRQTRKGTPDNGGERVDEVIEDGRIQDHYRRVGSERENFGGSFL